MDKNLDKINRFFRNIFKDKEINRIEFIVAIIVNIIFLYIFNNIPSWNISFITSAFVNILWIINLSLGANIVVNIIFIFYHPSWFRHSLQTFLNILSIMVLYYLYTIFPFNFSHEGIAIALKIVFILIMVILVLTTLIEIISTIYSILSRSE